MLNSIKEYGNNKVIHIFLDGENVVYQIYDSMLEFYLFGTSSMKYSKKMKCFIAKTKTNTSSVLHNTNTLCKTTEFLRKARIYKNRYKHNCYKALYAEIAIANKLNGRHNKVNTKHGKGDVVVNGIRYEVKFGNEVTI